MNGLKKIRADLIHCQSLFRIFCLPADNLKIYRTIIFPAVLYGCRSSSLTLMKENRLRVFENRVLGKIFGSRKDKVTGKWRRLHNEDLHDQYSSTNISQIRRKKCAEHVAGMGETIWAYKVLERKF
jgi:hypothetical protein